MLMISRFEGGSLLIGDDVELVVGVVHNRAGTAQVRVIAPEAMHVARLDTPAIPQRSYKLRIDQVISIGSQIKVMLQDVRGSAARLGIDAPRSVQIVRREILPRAEIDSIRNVYHQSGVVAPADVGILFAEIDRLRAMQREAS